MCSWALCLIIVKTKVHLNEQMSSGVAEVYNLLRVLCVAGDAKEMLRCTHALNCYSISY